MKNTGLKLFDTDKKVVFGQVGTIVEELKEGVFEVEFADRNGEMISEFAVKVEDLMLLHFDKEFVEK
jgi:hypothetical protein